MLERVTYGTCGTLGIAAPCRSDRMYMVLTPYQLQWSGKTLTVPRGFVSDGATMAPDWGWAWIFHDYLYKWKRFDDGSVCSRKEADEIFAAISKQEGSSIFARIFSCVADCNCCCLFSRAWGSV